MKQSEAWRLQMRSDFAVAEILYDRIKTNTKSGASLRCQAMAKYQQTAEKCVKALVATIKDNGVSINSITKSHVPDRQITALILAYSLLDDPTTKRLKRILSDKRRRQIEDLCKLAPKLAGAGKPLPRNTEYPFNPLDTDLNEWQAPASEEVFTMAEVDAAHSLCWELHFNVGKFVSAKRRSSASR